MPMGDQCTVSVGIGELHVSRDRTTVLTAYGLGSCVGVSLYDPVARVGGMAHVMLPSSKDANHQTSGYKFADLAVPALVEGVLKLGGKRDSLICKIVGGAQMLIAPGHTNGFRIGERNVEAVMEALREWRIVPRAMDTGGAHGRTVRLVVKTGQVTVRKAGGSTVEL